jgi:hypothetical protein
VITLFLSKQLNPILNRRFNAKNMGGNPTPVSLNPWRRLFDALSATLFVYLCRIAFSLSATIPVIHLLNASLYGRSNTMIIRKKWDIPLLLDIAHRILPDLQKQGLFWIGITLLYLLLLPLISMTWFCAIDNPRSLHNNIINAAHHYNPSLLISCSCLSSLFFSVSILIGLDRLFRSALGFTHNDRLSDIVSLGCVLCGLLVLLFLALLHDTSRSALCSERRFLASLKLGFRAICCVETVLSYLFWFSCSSLLTVVGALLVVYVDSGHSSTFVSFLLLQLIAIGRTILRGRWLVSSSLFVKANACSQTATS